MGLEVALAAGTLAASAFSTYKGMQEQKKAQKAARNRDALAKQRQEEERSLRNFEAAQARRREARQQRIRRASIVAQQFAGDARSTILEGAAGATTASFNRGVSNQSTRMQFDDRRIELGYQIGEANNAIQAARDRSSFWFGIAQQTAPTRGDFKTLGNAAGLG